MKQVEIQKRLRFRITKNGFLLDEQEGEFSEKILPWKEKFEADKWKALYGIGARFDENPLLFFVQNRQKELFHRKHTCNLFKQPLFIRYLTVCYIPASFANSRIVSLLIIFP